MTHHKDTKSLSGVLLSLLPLCLCGGIDPPLEKPTTKLDYNQHIRPILADRCFICHGPDENKRKGKLRLDRRDSATTRRAIVPGNPDESLVVQRITGDDDQRMPPHKSNLSLSQAEIETLRRWIAEGAEYQPHWAFMPLPDTVQVPSVSPAHWPVQPIDNFVAARLSVEKLSPSPPASREDWLRRVTFDLTGLPPSPWDVDEFLADASPAAFDKVVDRLLASPRFGERMAMDWIDVSRYADSFGYQADGDMHVWPWRDWVIRAFNSNLPFDKFITWQLAGDLVDRPTRDQRLATAFNRLNRMTNEGGSIPEEFRQEYVSDRVHTFSTAFLGLTMECARCHDHKYDPISMKDYYSLSGFFNNIDEWGTYDNSQFRPTPTMLLPTPAQERDINDKAKKASTLLARLSEIETKRVSVFQEWLKRTDLTPVIPGLIGDYPLDGLVGKHLVNRAYPKHAGTTSTANTFVPGKSGKALQFTGDDAATFPHVLGNVERWQPFTVSFWLQLPRSATDEIDGIIFHRQSGTDTGFHGTELSLEKGKLLFGLVRFWPGNTAAVCTSKPLADGRQPQSWTHVAVSYDGSSKAGGLRIFVDGAPVKVEVVRDSLVKDLQTAAGHGGGGTGLSFGERFRSVGLKGGAIDELRIYSRALSEVEIAHIHDDKALADAIRGKSIPKLKPYYFAALDGEATKLREELRKARQQLCAAQTAVFEIMTMEEQPTARPTYVLLRGEYDSPKSHPVERSTPTVLPPFPADAPRNRLGLARWLTDSRHPLTARVTVNRIWQMYFGAGLAPTIENFGQQGALPTHPALLDWLARNFINSGWDVKGFCRRIVLSATYRQRSAADQVLRERDPENVLLARGPSRRLSAEMLRDAALLSGGSLVERIGGPPVKPYQPPGLWHGQNAFLPEYVPDKGAGLYRRSLYTFWRRTSPPPNMLAFDAPGREVCVVRRQATNTPLQPLVLLNDPQFVETSRALAERMLRFDGSLNERLTFAFRAVTTRKPTEAELSQLRNLYERQHALFNESPDNAGKYLKIGDRPLPADIELSELAAATATASVILNLDAAVMLR